VADHNQAQVDLCERHARHYGDDDWWFLTYRGWAHTENGDVTPGRTLTQRAFELRPENADAAHALAHAMYEDGAIADAETLISEWLSGYGRSGPLYSHIAWHRALLALEKDNVERALAIYGCQLRHTRTVAAPVIVVSDSASLPWRLLIYGHDVPKERLEDAARYAEQAFPDAGFAFVDVHLLFSPPQTATGKPFSAGWRRWRAGHRGGRTRGPRICRAMLAFADEDYAGCLRLLEPVARRCRAHRRQPCPARSHRGHPACGPDAERRDREGARPARPAPSPAAVAARPALARPDRGVSRTDWDTLRPFTEMAACQRLSVLAIRNPTSLLPMLFEKKRLAERIHDDGFCQLPPRTTRRTQVRALHAEPSAGAAL
jgi:hypothetical protein